MTRKARSLVKSNKATVLTRVQEVTRILLAGGEFEDIRQYAAVQGWGVSDRQLRRYQEKSYDRLAAATGRNQKQLLGRHLMQRRAMYARAMKSGDIRAALAVLRDEAELEGLYDRDEQPALVHPTSPAERRERLCRLLKARQREDQEEIGLIDMTSPVLYYPLPDTRMPEMLLNVMALMHIGEQLDHAAMALTALWSIELGGDDQLEFWATMWKLHSWNFHVGQEGWRLFAKDLGVDPDWLIKSNHRGSFLELCADRLERVKPEAAEIQQMSDAYDDSLGPLATPEDVARGWHELLDEMDVKEPVAR